MKTSSLSLYWACSIWLSYTLISLDIWSFAALFISKAHTPRNSWKFWTLNSWLIGILFSCYCCNLIWATSPVIWIMIWSDSFIEASGALHAYVMIFKARRAPNATFISELITTWFVLASTEVTKNMQHVWIF